MSDPTAQLATLLPIAPRPWTAASDRVGLVIVDEINGFCTVGAGNLAPTRPNARVERMIEVTDGLARRFVAAGSPILAFLDTHEPGQEEPPYPLHCERGTGEEEFVPQLAWLNAEPLATLLRKDCINGFVGAIEPAHPGHGVSHNRVVDWINLNRLAAVVVVGICTDICVLDFVVTLLSARGHRLVSTLEDVVVLEEGCATYDLPAETVAALGLPATATHPQAAAHHVGLYVMAARGAVIAASVELAA